MNSGAETHEQHDEPIGLPQGTVELRRAASLIKTGALQDAIFNSAYFSSIATDERGVIQIQPSTTQACARRFSGSGARVGA